jgi:16S rRNA C1402 N4-methylase RsmH
MLEQTLTSLRRFVNDEVNELDFAVRVVAAAFLKPGSGLLFAMVHSPLEEKIVEKGSILQNTVSAENFLDK